MLEMNSKSNVCVVIPAAGVGSRLRNGDGDEVEKQFAIVLGKPVISYTISVFEKLSIVSHIIVVVSSAKEDYMKEIKDQYHQSESRIFIVVGSTTRHRSIYEGVKAIEIVCGDNLPEIVVIHDAVRPLVQVDDITLVISAAQQHGAAGLVRPLVSTVLEVNTENFLVKSLDRTTHKASEMPQAFGYTVLKISYEKCSQYDLEYGTECLHLVHKYTNSKVKLIDGPNHLSKITYKKDLKDFEDALKNHLFIYL